LFCLQVGDDPIKIGSELFPDSKSIVLASLGGYHLCKRLFVARQLRRHVAQKCGDLGRVLLALHILDHQVKVSHRSRHLVGVLDTARQQKIPSLVSQSANVRFDLFSCIEGLADGRYARHRRNGYERSNYSKHNDNNKTYKQPGTDFKIGKPFHFFILLCLRKILVLPLD
jgi:hypothetical protein